MLEGLRFSSYPIIITMWIWDSLYQMCINSRSSSLLKNIFLITLVRCIDLLSPSPAISNILQSGKYHYEVIFGTYEMHGSEGRLAGYVCNVNRAAISKSLIGLGRECKKGSTMNGFKDPISRAIARRSNLLRGVNRTPNVETEESAVKQEDSRVGIQQGDSAKDTTAGNAGNDDDNQSETSRNLFGTQSNVTQPNASSIKTAQHNTLLRLTPSSADLALDGSSDRI